MGGRPKRAFPNQPISRFLPKRVGWPCPVRSAHKRTPVQDFDSFSIMLYYIFSTTYQTIGDLFSPLIFLDFCRVCNYYPSPKRRKEKSIVLCIRTFDKKSIGSSFLT